jgi:hypothetical protein
MKADKRSRPNELMLAAQMRERRLHGDVRPLIELAREVAKDISASEAKHSLEARLCGLYLREARKLGLGEPEHEIELRLPFETGEIGRYRTQPLVRVHRNGLEDFLKPDVVTGKEINQHDAWELHQRRRAAAYTEKRKNDNAAHTQELASIGFDPDTQTNHEIHKLGDIRICVLCGEGPIAGDPMEIDHETPVAIGEGQGRKGWAHRSCNRSKGATEMEHGIPAR